MQMNSLYYLNLSPSLPLRRRHHCPLATVPCRAESPHAATTARSGPSPRSPRLRAVVPDFSFQLSEFQLLEKRGSALHPPGLGSPGPATHLLDPHFPCATSRNPIDEINDCLLFFDFRLSTRCAILRPMTASPSPSPSPETANPGPRAICGGIALAGGVVELCCMAACFLDKDAALSFFGVSFLLILPTLGLALVGFLRGEQPKWPAVAGGIIGPLPFVILISVSLYDDELRPAVRRLWHAHLDDSPSTAVSADLPDTGETPPLGKPANAPDTPRNGASGGSATGRSSAAARARWSAEAQAAVESWLRSDTNELFTPSFGKFVRLQGSGYVWPPLANIQGYDYLTLHRTAQFTEGTIPVVIYVTEGAVTAPGQTNVGTPVLDGPVSPAQGARIRVSHPEVRSEE